MNPFTGEPQVHQFVYSPEPKRFYVAPDTFEAAPDFPIAAFDYVGSLTGVNVQQMSERLNVLLDFFDVILLDESAARFRERVERDKKHAIGIKLMMDIITWLLEEYGLRPTEPSSPSSIMSGDDGGIASTVGV